MQFTSVTFDLDGTLVDSLPDLSAACQRMLQELGLPSRSLDEIGRFVGEGMAVLVERCLTFAAPPDAALLARGIAAFRHHYALTNGTLTRCYPGVEEALQAWQATGIAMAVVTNKPEAFTLQLLEKLALTPFFPVVVGGDTTPQRKPHPAPLLHACAVMERAVAGNLHIGDSRHDIATARNAGCAVYAVPYGYHGDEPLRADECDALVADIATALRLAQLPAR